MTVLTCNYFHEIWPSVDAVVTNSAQLPFCCLTVTVVPASPRPPEAMLSAGSRGEVERRSARRRCYRLPRTPPRLCTHTRCEFVGGRGWNELTHVAVSLNSLRPRREPTQNAKQRKCVAYRIAGHCDAKFRV